MAKRTAHGLNEIRKLVNVEEKIILQSSGGTPVVFDLNGVILPMTYVSQGTDYTNRIGDSIKLQKIEFKAALVKSNSSITTTCRCIIFRDLDNYGTAPTISDVLDAGAAGGNVLAQYNWLNRERFSILYDEMFTLDQVANPGEMIGWKAAHEGHVKYVGTAAAAASNGKGSIYILMVSDEATNTPTYRHSTRLTFTDN